MPKEYEKKPDRDKERTIGSRRHPCSPLRRRIPQPARKTDHGYERVHVNDYDYVHVD
jgi:hypothetical protein